MNSSLSEALFARDSSNFAISEVRSFDFTVKFENVILSILPSAVFLLAVPCRLIWLKKEPMKVRAVKVQRAKLV